MAVQGRDCRAALAAAVGHAHAWLDDVGERPVPPRVSIDAVLATLAGDLPDTGADPAAVVNELAAAVEPGLMAIGSGRFYGRMMGGTLPAALSVSNWSTDAEDVSRTIDTVRRATI